MGQGVAEIEEAVVAEALRGLRATPKTLTPWLFYDEVGSGLFEEITALPEYYLTRTERGILAAHADEIVAAAGVPLTVMELGAGTAAKTGLVLAAGVRAQGAVVYQPVDVSASALEEAARTLAASLPGVQVQAQTANYVTEKYRIARPDGARVLALYIGSSIGNFAPDEAVGVLRNLREHLEPGDALLLGTDLAPGFSAGSRKTEADLVAAYDDAAGVTAAFNRNVLARLNREAGADFDVDAFAHRARWNPGESRMEMHLESLRAQAVSVGGESVEFAAGETIHTENSYKFSAAMLGEMFAASGFRVERTWTDAGELFAVTMAIAE